MRSLVALRIVNSGSFFVVFSLTNFYDVVFYRFGSVYSKRERGVGWCVDVYTKCMDGAIVSIAHGAMSTFDKWKELRHHVRFMACQVMFTVNLDLVCFLV